VILTFKIYACLILQFVRFCYQRDKLLYVICKFYRQARRYHNLKAVKHLIKASNFNLSGCGYFTLDRKLMTSVRVVN